VEDGSRATASVCLDFERAARATTSCRFIGSTKAGGSLPRRPTITPMLSPFDLLRAGDPDCLEVLLQFRLRHSPSTGRNRTR